MTCFRCKITLDLKICQTRFDYVGIKIKIKNDKKQNVQSKKIILTGHIMYCINSVCLRQWACARKRTAGMVRIKNVFYMIVQQPDLQPNNPLALENMLLAGSPRASRFSVNNSSASFSLPSTAELTCRTSNSNMNGKNKKVSSNRIGVYYHL